MGNVKISAFSSQPDLSQIDGLAGYQGTLGNYTNAQISGTQLETYLQNNLNFATASGTQNTLAMFTSANAVGDSIINQVAATGSATVIQIGSSSSAAKLNVDTSTRYVGVYGNVNWTSGSGFTDYYGVSGSAGSNAGSPNWTNTGVLGSASRSDTRNTGVRGTGGNPGTVTNAGTNYGGHFSAKNGDNNYSLKLEDGTESAGKFLKCITADGEAQWAILPATVGSISIGTAVASTGEALTINNTGDAYVIVPKLYNGTTNVGFVPSGGTAQKLLAGDGSWQSPTFTAKQFPFSGVDTDPMLSVNVGETGAGVPVTTGQIRLVGGTNVTVTRTNDNTVTLSSSGGGTVTSVGLTMPTAFAVANSPLTGSGGTLAVTTTGGSSGQFLDYNGTWDTPSGTYVLPLASSSVRGGIKIGFPESGKNYPVELSSEQAFVNVPWTDNNDNNTYDLENVLDGGKPAITLYDTTSGSVVEGKVILNGVAPIVVGYGSSTQTNFSINSFTGTTKGAVPDATAASTDTFLKHDGTWSTPAGAGTVTSVSAVSPFSTVGFSLTVTDPTQAAKIDIAPINGAAGEYLDYTGDWSTPPNTTYTGGQGITISGSNVISVSTTGTVEVGDLKVDGKIINGTGVDLDIDSTEDIKIDAAKDIEVTAVGNTTGVTVNTDKAVTVNSKEAISLDVKSTATTATPVNVQPRRGGALVVHGDTTGGGSHEGSITLNCSQDSHGVTIKSPPHSASATYTLVLPTTDGSNAEVLQTDGSGNLSWATNGGSSGGGFPSTVSPASANTSTLVDTLYIVTTSALTADIVMTLPSAASNSGKIIGIKYGAQNAANDTVVIKTISNQTIDGNNRTTNGLPLASVYTYYELLSDGSNWWIK